MHTETELKLRASPETLAALREHRSVANLIEVLIRKHCEEQGISIPEQQALFEQPDHE